MDAWTGYVIAFISFGGGATITAYLARRLVARRLVRHAKRTERLGFVAALKTMADGIGEDTDPRRVAATLRLKAEQYQRSADALRESPSEHREAAPWSTSNRPPNF